MKYVFVFLTIWVSISFTSCNDNGTKESQVLFEIDSIVIDIDTLSLNYYNLFSNDHEQNRFIGYNHITHSIDILRLNEKKCEEHIKLERQGSNGIIGKVSGIYFHNVDSIFVLAYSNLYIINYKGIVIDKFDLTKYFVKEQPIYLNGENKSPIKYFEPITNYYFKLKYFERTGEIYFQNLYPTERIDECLESPVVFSFNLISKQGAILPIRFSKLFKKKKGRVGYLRWMNFESSKNDSLFFNSQFDDELIVFNKEENEVSISLINLNKNREITELKPNSDPQRWVHHSIENTHRFAFIYDKWNNYYYRFIWKGISVKLTDKQFNTMLDKPLLLEVYNSNFQVINTIKLPDHTYRINSWFIDKEGLYISPSHPHSPLVEENKFIYHIIKLM